MNHLRSTTDPLKNTTSYTYDPAGNLITTQDALSHVTTNAYDVYGRRYLLNFTYKLPSGERRVRD